MDTIFYEIYEIENGIPIYVGLTTRTVNQRFTEHIKAKDLDNDFYGIKEIYRIKHNDIKSLDDFRNEYNLASETEIRLIAEYQTKYKLANLSAGGEWGTTILHRLRKENFFVRYGSYNGFKEYRNEIERLDIWLKNWLLNRATNPLDIWLKDWSANKTKKPLDIWLKNWISHRATSPLDAWLKHWIWAKKENPLNAWLKHWIWVKKANLLDTWLKHWIFRRTASHLNTWLKNWVSNKTASPLKIWLNNWILHRNASPLGTWLKSWVANRIKTPLDTWLKSWIFNKAQILSVKLNKFKERPKMR